jgi:hypothetical protein
VKCSGDLLPPSPPAEKTTTRQDQAGHSCTGDGTGNGGWCYGARRSKHNYWITSVGADKRIGTWLNVGRANESYGPTVEAHERV